MVFYLPKLIVVGMLWFAAIILGTWERYNEMQDPTYSHIVDTNNYYVRISHSHLHIKHFLKV